MKDGVVLTSTLFCGVSTTSFTSLTSSSGFCSTTSFTSSSGKNGESSFDEVITIVSVGVKGAFETSGVIISGSISIG